MHLHRILVRVSLLAALLLAFSAAIYAQETPGGTTISNTATATYSDGSTTLNTSSNTVTTVVSNVSALVITPDASAQPTVVALQTGIQYIFTVQNTGNFTDQVRFKANGASIVKSGPVTITAAVIDVDNSNTINAGDTDILTNGADVVSANIAQNGTVKVIVQYSVNSGAAPGAGITIQLGDASGDNVAANSSAAEVRTESAASVNGKREAVGSYTTTVDNDAILQVAMTVPTGPTSLGADITYTVQLTNAGQRTIQNQALGSNNGVYVVVPFDTAKVYLKSGQTFPGGTLYTTTALSTAPLSATWTTSAPGDLTTVTRLAIPAGNLAAGASSSAVNVIVTVKTGINASNPVPAICDAFGKTTQGVALTDQSGDATANNGDNNADFGEGTTPGAGHGVVQYTNLALVGGVLLGPLGAANAIGPTNNNDDYVNLSVSTGITGVAPGGTTTASGVKTFDLTIQNTGNGNDTMTFTAPTVAAGFVVEVSTDGGTNWTTISGGGSKTLGMNFSTSAAVKVRVTAPSGKTVLTGYANTVRAASGNTPATTNDVICRLWTGFIQMNKSVAVSNSTGRGAATDPVPGAVLTYTVAYSNVTTANGASGCVDLTASNLVISEDGASGSNNWATWTTHVAGQASDSRGGTISGDTSGSNVLTDTVSSLSPGQSGSFLFKRAIK